MQAAHGNRKRLDLGAGIYAFDGHEAVFLGDAACDGSADNDIHLYDPVVGLPTQGASRPNAVQALIGADINLALAYGKMCKALPDHCKIVQLECETAARSQHRDQLAQEHGQICRGQVSDGVKEDSHAVERTCQRLLRRQRGQTSDVIAVGPNRARCDGDATHLGRGVDRAAASVVLTGEDGRMASRTSKELEEASSSASMEELARQDCGLRGEISVARNRSVEATMAAV